MKNVLCVLAFTIGLATAPCFAFDDTSAAWERFMILKQRLDKATTLRQMCNLTLSMQGQLLTIQGANLINDTPDYYKARSLHSQLETWRFKNGC